MLAKLFFTHSLMAFVLAVNAQTDKAEADSLVYETLTSVKHTENWHPTLTIHNSQLHETDEKGVFIVRGDSFQIRTLRSDFYVHKKNNLWIPINDSRYPMETFVNLLLNRITENRHTLELRHHQYGGKIPRIIIPMQNLYDILARNMQVYCSVTSIDKNEIRATLVFHQQKLNFIHMLEMKANTQELFDAQSIIYGNFYTNIPQTNVKELFKERNNK